VRLHRVGVQRELAAAAERHAGRRDHHRERRVADALVACWKRAIDRSSTSHMPAITAPVLSDRSAPAEKNFGSSLPITSPAMPSRSTRSSDFASRSSTLEPSVLLLLRNSSSATPSPRSSRRAPSFSSSTAPGRRGDAREPDVAVDRATGAYRPSKPSTSSPSAPAR
jgi:hypothetical protein